MLFQHVCYVKQCVTHGGVYKRVKRIFDEEEESKLDDQKGQEEEDVLAEGEDQHLQHHHDSQDRDGQ